MLSILVIRNIHTSQHVVNDVIVAYLLKFFGNSSEIHFYFSTGLMYLEDVIYFFAKYDIFSGMAEAVTNIKITLNLFIHFCYAPRRIY